MYRDTYVVYMLQCLLLDETSSGGEGPGNKLPPLKDTF